MMLCRLLTTKPLISATQSTLNTSLRNNGIVFRQFQRESRQTINSRVPTRNPTLKERLMAPAGPNGRQNGLELYKNGFNLNVFQLSELAEELWLEGLL